MSETSAYHPPKGHRPPDVDNTIKGTEDADVLIGTDLDDLICADDGDDTLDGGDGNDVLRGGFGDDVASGGAGDDRIGDGSGNDVLNGGEGADHLRATMGADTLDGGDGDDVLLSLADAGEPDPAQDPDGRVTEASTAPADDILTGGAGADTFIFRPLINATEDIIAKHTDEDTGRVHWRGVARENDNVHDHWVEGIGNDTITDFNADEGDTIVFSGHTASAEFAYGDSDNDGIDDYTIITLYSDQGARGGAHDGDVLGTVTVLGALVTADDVMIESKVFAAVDRLDTWDVL